MSIVLPKVVNVSERELKKRGIETFTDWLSLPTSVYIGCKSNYINGCSQSKWANPYKVGRFTLDETLKLYELYIRSNLELYGALKELEGKELGCWCSPNKCHGDVLVKLFGNL